MKRRKKKRCEMPEEDKKTSIEEEKTEAEAAAGTPEENDAKDARISELESKVKELEETIADLKDKALRDAADTENYKKRLRADKESAVRYANEGLIKDLLDPLDNFSRAVEAAGSTGDVESIKTGISMVESQLQSILRNNWGLEPYSPEGEDFNPSEMEACLVQEDENLDREKVLQVLLKGYKLNGKVIRAAKVMVGKPKKN